MLGSLLEDKTYTMRVLAFTSMGDSPLLDPIQVKMQQGGEAAAAWGLEAWSTHMCSWEAEARGSPVPAQPEQLSDLRLGILCQNLKKKNVGWRWILI